MVGNSFSATHTRIVYQYPVTLVPACEICPSAMVMSISSAQAFTSLEVGVILAALLNGVLALQLNRYIRKPSKDPRFIKLFIIFIWLVTIADLFLAASALHILTITNHGRPILETVFPLVLPVASSLGIVVCASVQSIYAYRLYQLTGHWAFPAVCWTLSVYILGSGIAYSIVEARMLTAALLFTTRWNWLFYSHFSAATAADILIAASTCWSLAQKRGHGLKSTQLLMNRIMLRIVQTGIATSVVAVCILIMFAVCQPSNAWLGLYIPLTPLYPITLLALFNG
ncbi:hypothetical protein BD779DRAFT_574673 [Infundibulicybe gibba]|nr:hypothetical protein BD779DRAFT_574673 [Infundibulicybe gibba]